MPQRLPPEAFDSLLDAGLPRREKLRRRDVRWAFYALVQDELEAGTLSARRERQLLRYAESLKIDVFEATLLINGARDRAAGLADDDAGVLARIGPRSRPAARATLPYEARSVRATAGELLSDDATRPGSTHRSMTLAVLVTLLALLVIRLLPG